MIAKQLVSTAMDIDDVGFEEIIDGIKTYREMKAVAALAIEMLAGQLADALQPETETADTTLHAGHSLVLNSTAEAGFQCHEPDTAWCRRNVVGPGEPPPTDPSSCWYTVLASGFELWSIYAGAELPLDAHSGPVIFTQHDDDGVTWRYVDEK